MLENLHMAGHVTGSVKAIDVGFFSEYLIRTPHRYTAGQMFFQPYQSGTEFLFCVRHTLEPLLILALGVLDPMVLPVTAAVFVGAAAGCLLVSFIGWCFNSDSLKSNGLQVANAIMTALVQTLLDMVVAPLAAVTLFTRSISTGLKVAGIYDYSAPAELVDAGHIPSSGSVL